MTQFVSAAQLDAAEWDAVVEASPEGWVFALSGWQRLILAVPRWALTDVSFAVVRDARLIAVVPLQYQASARRLASSGWGLAGPVPAAGLTAFERAEVLSAIMAHVEQMAGSLGADVIEMGRSPVTTFGMAGTGENPFLPFGFEDFSTQTKVLRLSGAEDELWRGLSKNARQMVKKAGALGYTVRQGAWPDLVDDYYRIHSETYERTGVVPHPREYFAGIASEMGRHGHAVLWVGYAPEGTPVAFHNDARLGPGTLYHTSCSESAHLDSGINYLLMWEAIRGAKQSGGLWYEVGEVFPDASDDKARGLTVFKSKFGGELRRSIKASRARPQVSSAPAPIDQTERRLRQAFNESTVYEPARVSRPVYTEGDDYTDRLLQTRFELASRHYRGGRMVDLCCATGSHLIDNAGQIDKAVGVDFSLRYLDVAQGLARTRGIDNVTFVQADARGLPLATGSVNLLYCFSSLYVIPGAEDVVTEVGRVLASGGRAVLDFGNRRSINAFCLRYYTDWAPPHLLTVRQIRGAIDAAGLRTVTHRRFQLLPLWAGRPSWLWPLLHPAWKNVLKRRLFGRMLDEWVSSLPGLRAFAFRHVIVCEKP
ncbi:MAG: peptidoglycan bridge formation glycyltransferase FemA/FemB family protein [Acidobacteriota bacterium]|nr:peptidoglycan bridge formation glycyltransferase FemA/FemB family protein [Acidobacteriota bacterium]